MNNVWIVRWRKLNAGNKHVYNTQATDFRVFDTFESAEGFRNELRRRIKLRYEADYGVSEDLHNYRSCISGSLHEPDGYSVDTKNGVTVEIVCAKMNDSTLQVWEVAVE